MKWSEQIAGLLLWPAFTIIAFSCKKEEQNSSSVNEPPPPGPKTVKAKVIEYGNDLPIDSATLFVCSTPLASDSCPGNYKTFTTNATGECFFEAEAKYFVREIWKEGYVSLIHQPHNPCLSEPDQWGGYGDATVDSFLFRMVPYRNVTVHLKNANTNLDADVYFGFRVIYYSRTNIECRSGLMNLLTLRPNIDTTFQYLAYGNIENEYFITRSYDNDQGILIGPVYLKKEYIPKDGYITVEINY
jgi:hypothetical protein